jgi:predicted CXXCH cytochrome family protein
MMKRLPILLFLLLLTSPALALDIFYPADGTYVTRSNFLIVRAGADVEGLTLDIGGEKSDLLDISGDDYRAAFGDFLIVQPAWDSGKNTVKVEAYKGGKVVAEKGAVFFFQDNPGTVPPENYKPFIMHTPEQEAQCVACHNMNPTPAQLQLTGADNPCASCHARMLETKNVHGPAGAWQCIYCHDTEAAPRYAPRSRNADLCNECHDDMTKESSEVKFVHGPVAVGLCTLCHDAHASDNPAQLLRPINQLCLGCHEGIDGGTHVTRGVSGNPHPLSGIPDPSREGELSCVGCHSPHGGKSPYLFRNGLSGRMSLCQICHSK